jgi:hypothetical protein
MKALLALCVVAVATLASVGCFSETVPQTDQSETSSAVVTACDPIYEPGDGTVLFCARRQRCQ